MVTKGLLVRLQANRKKELDVEEFLRSALPLVEDEPETTAWFAVRFGRHEYGIFDVFQDEAGRQAHLSASPSSVSWNAFLNAGLSLVEQEPGTAAWFAIHTDDGHYGIFDAFPDRGARFAHLTGHVPRQLVKHATTLIGGLPDVDMLSVLAFKLPR